jgi:phage/plasmid-associated DNA primase
VTARFLYGEHFEFKPAFKLFLAANHKPPIHNQDHGIWRRISLIPFDVRIPKEQQDRSLPNKLRQELPGILAWGVQGCLAWQRDGLREPEEVREATDEYKTEMDILGDFIAAHAELDSSATVEASVVYHQYVAWAERSGEKPMTKAMFGHRLSERGFRQCKVGRNSARGWGGLRLTSRASGADGDDGSSVAVAAADTSDQADTSDRVFGKVPYISSIPQTFPKMAEKVSAEEVLSAHRTLNDRTERPLSASELTDDACQPHAATNPEEIREWRSA